MSSREGHFSSKAIVRWNIFLCSAVASSDIISGLPSWRTIVGWITFLRSSSVHVVSLDITICRQCQHQVTPDIMIYTQCQHQVTCTHTYMYIPWLLSSHQRFWYPVTSHLLLSHYMHLALSTPRCLCWCKIC